MFVRREECLQVKKLILRQRVNAPDLRAIQEAREGLRKDSLREWPLLSADRRRREASAPTNIVWAEDRFRARL
jgi:hypothetical protein